MSTHYRRFRDISVCEKMLDTLFLLTIGLGYLFALTHLYYTHNGRDGKPGLSVQDVMIAYYGSHDQTRLAAAINGGPMEQNLKSPADKLQIHRLRTAFQMTVFELTLNLQKQAAAIGPDCVKT